jgi:hypothetical protein
MDDLWLTLATKQQDFRRSWFMTAEIYKERYLDYVRGDLGDLLQYNYCMARSADCHQLSLHYMVMHREGV